MYTDYILKRMPVVLSQIDRDRHSMTYGCCDRNFWHLKIRDFSSAILQQSGLALAIAYLTNFNGNIYYNNSNIKDWAEATVYYWAKIQLKDGSFNEYYPWEHGFPPTAFSLYSTCEIYKRLNMSDPNIEEKIRKTANYLCNTIESKAMNQEIASITALYSAYSILHDNSILHGINKKMELVLKAQSCEGWFPEYGGADIGYLSVSLDMLAEYYWMSKDKRVLEPLNKTFDFICHFIHPDNTIGGEYGSRNTTYFLPNGIEVMAILGDSRAEEMIHRLYGNCLSPCHFMDGVDDRYLSHYILHSMLRAEEKRIHSVHPVPGFLPIDKKNYTLFTEAGLIEFNTGIFCGIISARKGGTVKLYDSNQTEILTDCGYRIDYGNGTAAATNWTDDSYIINYGDKAVTINGYMNKVSLKVPSPVLHLGLRCISFIFGNKIINYLKKKIILVDKHSDIHFSRKIKIKEDFIELEDTINSPAKVIVEQAGNMSLRHVASGKFFSVSDLKAEQNGKYECNNELKLRTKIEFINGEARISHDRLG